MCPFIFLNGFGFNTEAYIKCQKEVVMSWIEKMAAGSPYVWLQDCTMPHPQEEPVLAARKFLWENFGSWFLSRLEAMVDANDNFFE